MSELFHVQSSRWYTIADDHLTALYSEIKAFVKAVLSHITKDSRILAELWEITKLSLQESKHAADEELSKLCQDEKQQPITYNHYYTDNVQNARQQSTRNLIKKAMTGTVNFISATTPLMPRSFSRRYRNASLLTWTCRSHQWDWGLVGLMI